MRNATRLTAAAALVLPLLFGAGDAALAAGGKKVPKASGLIQDQNQATANSTVQNNINVSPVNQVSIGSKGEQSAMTWTNQNNINESEQSDYQEQDED